jgi:carboxyl-terminal processing protease
MHMPIYDSAASILRERYYDHAFRETKLVELVQEYRPPAGEERNVAAQRDALTRLLSHIPTSHLGVLSEASLNYLLAELSGQKRPTVGLHAVGIEHDYFTSFLLEGGPAAEAGIAAWERIASIDGVPTGESARLDYQQKDAYLSVDRDPPVHSILCNDAEEIALVLERTRSEQRTVRLRSRPYSALEAARASARVLKTDGRELGYVHFWFIHSSGVLELLRELFDDKFRNLDGLVLDLRGRGGNGVLVDRILQLLSDWGRPIVALTDRQSRSAKDALAYEFKQRRLATVVGERTAGAVIPATFAPLGDQTVLMFPSFTLGRYTEKLELKGGVEPDMFIERAGPYSAGADPILERSLQELVRQVATAAPRSKPAARLRAANSAGGHPPTDLPRVDELVTRVVQALGGEKALRGHRHRTLSGTTEFVGLPMKGEFLQKASAPDKSLVAMNLGDLRIKQGFDGTTAWSETSMQGLQILTGSAAEAVKEQAKFYGPLDLIASNKQVTPIAFTDFDGKECIEVKLVSASGGVSFLYVDAATDLIAGTKATVETPIGAVESKTCFRNYKELNGFTTATEIFIESSVQRQLVRIDSVSFDPIPPEAYAVPATTR